MTSRQDGSAKILTLDIETSPNIADVWGLFNQNIGLNQLRETSKVICLAWKWHDSTKTHFASEFHHGRETMIEEAYKALDRADITVHYNGDRFDLPHLRREFALAGYTPPAPSQSVDLLKVVRKQFRFTSNKLDHVAQQFNLGAKVSHSGHSLWTNCLLGDEKAWAKMKKYNMGDVRLTEKLYDRLLPWIYNHPHAGLFAGISEACNKCASTRIERRGYYYRGMTKFARYKCQDCGGWGKFSAREDAVTTMGIA